MARYNEILAGRYNRMLQKLFGLKGGPPAPQLASEIGVTFNLFGGAENRYLEDWDRFAVVLSPAAQGAATPAATRLRNPLGSGVIVVIEKITVNNNSAVADAYEMSMAGPPVVIADLAAVSATQGRFDSRFGPQSTRTAIVPSQGTAVSLGTNLLTVALPATTGTIDVISFEDQEIPLLPGNAVQVREIVGNQPMICSYWWRQRALEDSERF